MTLTGPCAVDGCAEHGVSAQYGTPASPAAEAVVRAAFARVNARPSQVIDNGKFVIGRAYFCVAHHPGPTVYEEPGT